MQLSSKLETLLMMGVKAAGSYNPMNALAPMSMAESGSNVAEQAGQENCISELPHALSSS